MGWGYQAHKSIVLMPQLVSSLTYNVMYIIYYMMFILQLLASMWRVSHIKTSNFKVRQIWTGHASKIICLTAIKFLFFPVWDLGGQTSIRSVGLDV